MRTNAPKELFSENNFVRLKSKDWLEKQRVAGKVCAETLLLLEQEVKSGTTKSLLELDKLAETYIRDNGCTPTFLLYKGFPNSVCISVNKQLVHGICTDYKLQDGDLVSFDLGATYKGAIADTAITCIFGQPKSEKHVQLLKATEEVLMQGIRAIEVGKRLGCIGQAIAKHTKRLGFGLITQYGGHGISWDTPHDAPFVANEATENDGIRIQPGLTIAIEPMLVLGSSKTHVANDGWTVLTDSLGSHQEHTIFVHTDHVEIITWRHNETYFNSNKVNFNKMTTENDYSNRSKL